MPPEDDYARRLRWTIGEISPRLHLDLFESILSHSPFLIALFSLAYRAGMPRRSRAKTGGGSAGISE